MNIMSRIRIYHAALALLAIAAYLTGGSGIIHSWLGYGIAIVIALRLLWAIVGERQVGLMRFYPSFKGLKLDNVFRHPAISHTFMLGIALCLFGAAATGIAMDRGRSIGLNNADVVTATANVVDDSEDGDEDEKGHHEKHGVLGEIHEFFGNLLLAFVGMHVAYLLLFKRTLAKFMLFIPRQTHATAPINRH
jgi:cytochrome b